MNEHCARCATAGATPARFLPIFMMLGVACVAIQAIAFFGVVPVVDAVTGQMKVPDAEAVAEYIMVMAIGDTEARPKGGTLEYRSAWHHAKQPKLLYDIFFGAFSHQSYPTTIVAGLTQTYIRPYIHMRAPRRQQAGGE